MLHDILTLLLGAALVSIGVLAGGLADRIRGMRFERRMGAAPMLPRPAATTAKTPRAARAPHAQRQSIPLAESGSKKLGEGVMAFLTNAGYTKSEAAMAVSSTPDSERNTMESWMRAALTKLNSRGCLGAS